MIHPIGAIKDPGLDGFFKKAEREADKKIKEDNLKACMKYVQDCITRADKLEESMNKPATPIKIFYSQPMHNKTEEEIEDKIDRLDNYIYGILRYCGFKETDIYRIEFINNFKHEGLDADAGRLMHLGRSIQQMQDADLVIFNEHYFMSEGCLVEEAVCEEYKIPHIYITDKDDENTFERDFISWFKIYLGIDNVSK